MPPPVENNSKKRRLPLLLPLALIVFLAAAVAWVISSSRPREQPFQWLSQTEANRVWRPGLFESIRNCVLRWPPAARLLTYNRQAVMIRSQVTTSPGADCLRKLNARWTETSRVGDLAYLLDPSELAEARAALASLATNSHLPNSEIHEGIARRVHLSVKASQSAMSMTTFSGMRSSMSSGSASSGGAFCGATLDVFPTIRHRQFSLFVRAAFTQPMTNLVSGVLTNISISFRATLPNAGAVLLRHVDETTDPAVTYWLIKVTAVDSKGNPISLGK